MTTTSQPSKKFRVVIAKRNSVEEIHKPGCRDLKNSRGFRNSDREDYALAVDDLSEIYSDYWQCIDDEAMANDPTTYPTLEHVWWSWRDEFKLMPCAGNIPEMADPTSKRSQANPTADRLAAQHNRTAYRIAELREKIEWLENKQRTQYAAAMAALHDGQQMHHGKEAVYGASEISVVY